MATDMNQTDLDQKSDVSDSLRKIQALGAVLANQDWDTPLAGQDLQYFGFLIQDLARKAEKTLCPDRGSDPPQHAPEGGES